MLTPLSDLVWGSMTSPTQGAGRSCKIAFARAVGLSTTAEGVEDADQLVRLRELGADRVQAYYCSKPIPAEALEALLFKPRPMFQRLERAA